MILLWLNIKKKKINLFLIYFQVKLSDSFGVKNKIKEKKPLEIEYIRKKNSYIMNIEIEKEFSFFIY